MGDHKSRTPEELKIRQERMRKVRAMQTPEQTVEAARKGGRISGEKKRLNTTFKLALEWALEMKAIPTEDKYIEEMREKFPELTNREAIAISMARAAIEDRNAKAFLAVRDTIGEAPTIDISSKEPMTITIKTVD